VLRPLFGVSGHRDGGKGPQTSEWGEGVGDKRSPLRISEKAGGGVKRPLFSHIGEGGGVPPFSISGEGEGGRRPLFSISESQLNTCGRRGGGPAGHYSTVH
jgi:hypothetical protein